MTEHYIIAALAVSSVAGWTLAVARKNMHADWRKSSEGWERVCAKWQKLSAERLIQIGRMSSTTAQRELDDAKGKPAGAGLTSSITAEQYQAERNRGMTNVAGLEGK